MYLDDNQIGDAGVLLFFTMMESNHSIQFVSLRNNSITDPGLLILCHHIRNGALSFSYQVTKPSMQQVDVSNNRIREKATLQFIENTNAQCGREAVRFSPPASPLLSSSSEALHNKHCKDLCKVVQLLHILACSAGFDSLPLQIPPQLRFNPHNESHRSLHSLHSR